MPYAEAEGKPQFAGMNAGSSGGGGGSSYTLPPATASTLGGVKIGSGIEVTNDGTISASGGSGGGGLTFLKKGTTSSSSFNINDVIGNHRKILIYFKSTAIKNNVTYSVYLDLDFFNDYYSVDFASGSIYLSVGCGYFKSNNSLAALGVIYSHSSNDSITFASLDGGNINIDAYYVYALD